MRLWIVSDLHMELTRGWDLPDVQSRPPFEVMVVAGDLIPRMERGVAWLLERVKNRPVIYVPGNHEAYGADLDRTVGKARLRAAGTNVHVLQNDRLTIDGVTFLGATGWTDFDLLGDPYTAMRVAAEMMNDYRKIRIGNYQYRLRPEHALARNIETRAFLERELSKPKVGRRVVVTHMGFHAEAVPNGSENDIFSAVYTSRKPIDGADLWIYGHTHETRDFLAGSTRVVSNAKGYGPWRSQAKWQNPNFDPAFVVEI